MGGSLQLSNDDHPLAFSALRSVRGHERPSQVDTTWGELRAALLSFVVHPDKLDCWAWSPALFDGNGRFNTNVTRVTCLVGDFDDEHEDDMAVVLAGLNRLGLEYLLHTSYSHPVATLSQLVRCRIILPLTRPILNTEYQEWIRRAYLLFYRKAGVKELKTLSRFFFGPCVSDTKHMATAMGYHHPGKLLDTDAMLSMPCDFKFTADLELGDQPIPRDVLKHVARKWKNKRTSSWFQQLYMWLDQVIKGESYAEHGDRDTTTYKLCQALANEIPHGRAASIAEHFAPSLQLMNMSHPTKMTTEGVKDKLERAQLTAIEERLQQAKELEEEQQSRTRQAWLSQGIERTTAYTDRELEYFCTIESCAPSEFRRRWVIRAENSVYFYLNGTYTQSFGVRGSAVNAATTYLAPARSANVGVHHFTPTGEVSLKGIQRLVDEYGQVASRVVVSLTDQRSRFDDLTKEIIEAPFPLRDLEPTFNTEVDEWLRVLTGPKYPILERWIHFLTKLDHPCAALYLWGDPHVGKSYLAKCCSRLWNEKGATPLGEAMKDFNSTILSNPFLFGDEKMPTDFRGNSRTSELREWIQRRTTVLVRKYQDGAEVRGSWRFMLAANNEDLLSTNEELTPADVSAIGERILMMHGFAASIPVIQRYIPNWHDDTVAQHFRYIQTAMAFKADGRFLVKDPDLTAHKGLTTRSGARYLLCEFMTKLLISNSQRNMAKSNKLLVIKDRELYVKRDVFMQLWPVIMGEQSMIPRGSAITKALKALSKTKDSVRIGDLGRYRLIDEALLIAWAEDNDVCDAHDIYDALRGNEVTQQPIAFNQANNSLTMITGGKFG